MFKVITPSLLVFGLLVGCAKEKSYDTKYKEVEQLAKSSIRTHQMGMALDGTSKLVPVKYLYVPMTLGTPREVVAAAPFYQGDEKVVRLEWSKDGLEVLEIEMDERFNDNELNDLPVLTIPGIHISYKCTEDEFGECTNKEEENTEISWEQKTHFNPDYAGLSVKELNMLDAANVEGDSCVTSLGAKVVDYEISDGVINIELEKSYKLRNSWGCIWRNYVEDKFSYNSFKVKFFYSLVELDQLVTLGYKTINYPTPDHDEFGFFKNERLVLNDEFDSQRKEREILLNRWSPIRKNNELLYYLSSNFSKPKNKMLLDATHKTINVINKGLKTANSPFQIKLVEQELGKKEVSPGDLRYNTIVLIEDPLANGLLGYGPSVSNPFTGEIVQAHVNMYGGVLKSIVRRIYNAAADITIERAKGEAEMLSGITVTAEALSVLPGPLATMLATAIEEVEESTETDLATGELEFDVTRVKEISTEGVISDDSRSKRLNSLSIQDIEKRLQLRMNEKVNLRVQLAQRLNGNLEGLDALERKTIELETQEYGENINHKHSPEFFPIGGTTKVVYPELFKVLGVKNTDGTLKKFDELTKTQKKQVFQIVLEKSWMATLIHEIGHNLGLRHNFTGSTDKDNFYTKAEAELLGMEGQPAYSSIMEYSYSKFNQLKALGKYDIAALRFAYAREVELKDGSIAKVSGSISNFDEQLALDGKSRKEYSYCTDENAGLSSLCNRFDEGTTLEEIAKFRIKNYQDMYQYRNFRDGKLDFSAYDLEAYAIWRDRELGQIRDIIEEYEFFFEIFGEQTMTVGCNADEVSKYPICVRINDTLAATKVVGDFFINILKTPDHLCAIAKADKPNVIVEYRKLFDLYNGLKFQINYVTTSCFDSAVTAELAKTQLIVIGENGKFLNGFKDNNPNYRYATDRAVIGTWTDKVFALKNIFQRRWRNRSTDSNHMALIDLPFVKGKAVNILEHYTLGKPLTEPLPFTTRKGAKFIVPYVIGNDNQIEQIEDVFFWMKNFFGMNQSGKSNLIEIALKQIENIGVRFGEAKSDKAFVAANIAAIDVKSGIVPVDERSSDRIYFYDPETLITYIADKSMPIANLALTTIIEKTNLDAIDKDFVQSVFNKRTNPQAPIEFSNAHKNFFSLPASLQEQLISLSEQGATVPEQAFIDALGPENGPIIFGVYNNEGFIIMKSIVDTKTRIMTTPLNETERPLFGYPLDLLSQYLRGQITDELVEYYKNQLKRLPGFQRRANI
jgi:hypothetical protein